MSDTTHKEALNDYFSSMFDNSLATSLQKVTEEAEKEQIVEVYVENRDYSTIELDHQLTMTLDLFSKSLEKLESADKAIVSMELVMLLKQLPESRVKDMLNERYQAIAKASEAA